MQIQPKRVELSIVTLSPDQWHLFKNIRLEALSTDPQAFGESYDDAVKHSASEWQDFMRYMWFATINDHIVGMVGLLDEQKSAEKRAARIVSFWVRPSFRGQGIGRALLQKVQECARKHAFKELFLYVSPSQESAIKLYISMGFKQNRTIVDVNNPHLQLMVWQVSEG